MGYKRNPWRLLGLFSLTVVGTALVSRLPGINRICCEKSLIWVWIPPKIESPVTMAWTYLWSSFHANLVHSFSRTNKRNKSHNLLGEAIQLLQSPMKLCLKRARVALKRLNIPAVRGFTAFFSGLLRFFQNTRVLFNIRVVGGSAFYSYLSPQDGRPLYHPAVDRWAGRQHATRRIICLSFAIGPTVAESCCAK